MAIQTNEIEVKDGKKVHFKGTAGELIKMITFARTMAQTIKNDISSGHIEEFNENIDFELYNQFANSL